jgi:hypothetical protein
MYVFWHGRGYWVVCLAALGMFLPMIVLRQVDGPDADQDVALALGLIAVVIFVLGLRWNRGGAQGAPARHSFWGLPMQIWASPMLLFALLLGTRLITSAEEPRPARGAISTPDGRPK